MSDMRRMMMMFTRPVDSGGGGDVPAPTILPASGSISSLQTISISISGIAVSAEYSTDSINWTTYTAPFTLSDNTTVYARAIDGDGNYSDVVSNSYTIAYDAQVEYLQSSGTQWINTNFVISQDNVRAIADAQVSATGDNIIFGTSLSSSPRFNINWYNKTRMYFRYKSYDSYVVTTDARHIIEIGDSLKIDGITKVSPSITGSFNGRTEKIALFGKANASEPTSVIYPFKGKLYEFWIYYGDELKLHFIPVRKNGVGYMYDTVSGELFGNSGTGSFTYGNDVNE